MSCTALCHCSIVKVDVVQKASQPGASSSGAAWASGAADGAVGDFNEGDAMHGCDLLRQLSRARP
jgi:hypothetical protein